MVGVAEVRIIGLLYWYTGHLDEGNLDVGKIITTGTMTMVCNGYHH